MKTEKQSHFFDVFEKQRIVPVVPDTVPRQLVQRGGQETSHDAAEGLIKSGRLSEHSRTALELVRRHAGLTGAELDEMGNAEKRQVSKRLSGLADCSPPLIRRGEPRVCKVNKTRCTTWWPI